MTREGSATGPRIRSPTASPDLCGLHGSYRGGGAVATGFIMQNIHVMTIPQLHKCQSNMNSYALYYSIPI